MIPNKRHTPQKAKIMEFLHSTHSHPTAEQVYDEVKRDLPKVSLATVYRNLNQEAKEGNILRLEIDGEYHYDAQISMHQHCICNICKKVVDIHNKKLSKTALESLNTKGFSPQSVSIAFRGLCQNCRGK